MLFQEKREGPLRATKNPEALVEPIPIGARIGALMARLQDPRG